MKLLKKLSRSALCILMALSLVAVPVYADEQSDLEERNSELEADIAEEQARVAELQNSISETEDYIAALQAEMEHIEDIINGYETEKDEKRAYIDELNSQISEMEVRISDEETEISHQYELMKLRIRFLYENVGDSFIESILSSGSFSEAIEKVRYLLEISSYDRSVMVKVQGMKEQVETDKSTMEGQVVLMEDQLAEIDELEGAQEAQQELYAQTQELQQEELSKQQGELDEAQAVIDSFYAEIAANEDRINSLIAEFEASRASQDEEAEAQRQAEVEARVDELIEEAEENGEEYDEEDFYNQAEEEVPSYSSGGSQGFIWPLSGYYNITSYFGYRDDEDVISTGASYYHEGIDIYAPEGTPIMAVADGVVVSSYWSDGIGYVVIIYHGDGLFTEAHHMCQMAPVSVGETVYQGETIGYTGSTGQYCTGPHLHFGVSAGNDAYALANFVDPLAYL